MYRKSVDYGQQSAIQTVQFSSFKRKTQQTIQLIIDNPTTQQFRINKTNNAMLLIIIITDLYIQSRSKISKYQQSPYLINNKTTNNVKMFGQFIIDNIPKNYYNYQHQNTLQQLWNIISARAKDLYALQDLIVNYTITQFVMNCYGRKCIRNYIDNNHNKQLDLFGNQNQVLIDYGMEIRGKLLHFLAHQLKMEVSILYKDAAGTLENVYREALGDKNSTHKLQIADNGQFYKATIYLPDHYQYQSVKLSAANSTANIMTTSYIKRQHQQSQTASQSLTHRQMQSKSANKDFRCVKCYGKLKCECENRNIITKKIIGQRPVTNINNNTPLASRSVFDSVGLGTAPKRQTSNQEINVIRK